MLFESFPDALSFLLWSTFLLSVLFGLVATKTNFCTMGAVSDMVNMNDFSRFRAWLLAIACAITGVTLLEYSGMLDVSETFPPYRGSQLVYAENIIGGLMFGIGMTLASGCGNKTLIRIGGGNLKSIVVFIIIAIIAYYMTNPFPDSDQTLYSVLFYDWTTPLSVSLDSKQDIGALLSSENTNLMRLIAGLTIAAALLFFVFKSTDFRSNKDNVSSGIIIGVVIVAAWYISSNIQINADDSHYSLGDYYQEWDMLAESDEGKPLQGRTLSTQSFTFINPIGQSFNYVKEGFEQTLLTFGLISIFGIIFGSLVWSLISRSFRIEWFVDTRDFINHFIGALLMGLGGVLAMGCTIGQGITGVSTLAIGSFLALASIIFSCALTMKIQYYKIVYEEEATFFKAFITALVDMKLLPASMRKLDAI